MRTKSKHFVSRQIERGMACALVLSAVSWCTSALAEEATPAPVEVKQTEAPTPSTPEAPAAEPAADEAYEATRRSVRSTVEWLARGIDSGFGDKPFSDGGKVSDGQIGLSLLGRQHSKPGNNLRFNARFRLPNLEKFRYVFVGSDSAREVVTDQPEVFSQQELLKQGTPEDNTFFAGIGTRLRNAVDMRLGFRGGLKPYAQARYRHPWQWTPADLVEFRETIFVTARDRFGSTTAASYEHAFTSSLAARWLSAATITQASGKLGWSSNAGLHQSFGDHRVLSLEAQFTGVKGAAVKVSDYGLQAKWAQPVHKDSLIGEVLIGHYWPRPDEFSPRGRAWALGGVITLKF